MQAPKKFNPLIMIYTDDYAFRDVLTELFTETSSLQAQSQESYNSPELLKKIDFQIYKLIANLTHIIIEYYNNKYFQTPCSPDPKPTSTETDNRWVQEGLISTFSLAFNTFIDNKEKREFIAKCWINIVEKINFDVRLLTEEWFKYIAMPNFFGYFG